MEDYNFKFYNYTGVDIEVSFSPDGRDSSEVVQEVDQGDYESSTIRVDPSITSSIKFTVKSKDDNYDMRFESELTLSELDSTNYTGSNIIVFSVDPASGGTTFYDKSTGFYGKCDGTQIVYGAFVPGKLEQKNPGMIRYAPCGTNMTQANIAGTDPVKCGLPMWAIWLIVLVFFIIVVVVIIVFIALISGLVMYMKKRRR